MAPVWGWAALFFAPPREERAVPNLAKLEQYGTLPLWERVVLFSTILEAAHRGPIQQSLLHVGQGFYRVGWASFHCPPNGMGHRALCSRTAHLDRGPGPYHTYFATIDRGLFFSELKEEDRPARALRCSVCHIGWQVACFWK